MSNTMTASDTVIPAIRMANRSRPFSRNMIFHSDRGIQYASKKTVNVLIFFNVEQSMSRMIISEHRHPIFRLKIRSVFRSITTHFVRYLCTS